MSIADYTVIARFPSTESCTPDDELATALSFAQADMAIRLARRDALLTGAFDSDAYDVAIEQRRVARRHLEAAHTDTPRATVLPLRPRTLTAPAVAAVISQLAA